MSTCARCGHELGVGRFCTNCGHPIGQPVPESEVLPRLGDAPLAGQAGGPRPRWVLVAVGAALVVLLLVVLASCLGDEAGDGDGSSGRAARPAPGAATAGPARGPAVASYGSGHFTSDRITSARPTASGATSHSRPLVPSCAQYSPVIVCS